MANTPPGDSMPTINFPGPLGSGESPGRPSWRLTAALITAAGTIAAAFVGGMYARGGTKAPPVASPPVSWSNVSPSTNINFPINGNGGSSQGSYVNIEAALDRQEASTSDSSDADFYTVTQTTANAQGQQQTTSAFFMPINGARISTPFGTTIPTVAECEHYFATTPATMNGAQAAPVPIIGQNNYCVLTSGIGKTSQLIEMEVNFVLYSNNAPQEWNLDFTPGPLQPTQS